MDGKVISLYNMFNFRNENKYTANEKVNQMQKKEERLSKVSEMYANDVV